MASTTENEAATPAVDTPDSNNIHGSPLTKERFEQELQEALNTKSKFGSNFTTEQIGLGQGFLSIMFRAKLDWEGEDAAGLPPSVVCKVPTMVTMIQISKATGLDKKMEQINEETNANFDFEKATAAFLSMLKLTIYRVGQKKGHQGVILKKTASDLKRPTTKDSPWVGLHIAWVGGNCYLNVYL
uniref:Uncharacterized protein n=1 Tax=Plectus sambesii TaxID=2011161 RepID=A0A914XRB3_9BILA